MRSTRRHLVLATVVLLASVAGFVATHSQGERVAAELSSARADSAATHVLERIDLASSYVDTVRRFVVGRESLTQDSFVDFVDDALGSAGFSVVAWVQPVPSAERVAYERAQRRPIVELRGPLGRANADPRDLHLPAAFLRLADDDTRPGLDFATHRELLDVVGRIDARDDVAASAPLTEYAGERGLWLVESAPRLTDDAVIPGFVVAFVPRRFFEGALGPDIGELRVEIGADRAPSGLTTTSFGAAAQRWYVSVPRAPVSSAARALPWSIGTGGLLLALCVLALGVGTTARRNAREDLDRIFLLSRDLIGTANLDCYFTRVNPAFERVLGYTGAELLQRPFLDFVHQDDLEATVAEASRLSMGAETASFTNRYRCKDGSYRWLEWSAVGVPEREEIYFVARDITDRRAADGERAQLESDLLQAQKLEAMGRLAGGMAHDFNNVLTVVTGYAELVLRQLEKDSAAHADVEEIRRAAEQARSLTRHLLLFSRRGLPEAESTDPNETVEQMHRLLGRLIGVEVELVTSLQPGLGHVPLDRGQLEQIIVNLALNARDAMPNGGRLTVLTSRYWAGEDARELTGAVRPLKPGPYVLVVVRDDGIGMDADTRAQAVDPFFTTKPVGQGTGLGLSTVWGTVERAGGRVMLDSELGRGATVTLYLPEVIPARCEKDEPVHELPRGSGTVLVVDDDDHVRSLTARILARHGHVVVEARDAPTALTLWHERLGETDTLVSDIVMGSGHGVDLAEQLLGERADLAIVLMSGYPGDAVPERLQLSGVVYLQKPFSSDALLQAVREARENGQRRHGLVRRRGGERR